MTRRHLILTCAAGVWVGLILLISAGQWTYATTAGEPAAAPDQWPAPSALKTNPSQHTLVLFLHPRCPCSHATLAELDRILAESASTATCHIVFVCPDPAAPGWEEGPLLKRADLIPGAAIHIDRSAREARRFATRTSGQLLLYTPSGRLVFSGGITASRGHQGPNPGARAVRDLLASRPRQTSFTPVFGCPLQSPTDAPTGAAPACCEP